MDFTLRVLASIKALFLRITEVLALFVALIVLVHLLLGEEAGPLVTGVVVNLTHIIAAVTPQTLIAVALVIGLYLILRRRD